MFRPTKRVEGAHRDGIWSVSWSKDKIFTGSLDGTAKLWKEDLTLVSTTIEQKLGITSVLALHNSTSVITCCQDSIIRFYNTPDLEEYSSIDPGHLEAISISLSPTDDCIAAGTHTGIVNLWATSNQIKIETLQTSEDCKFILTTAFSPDGSKIVAASIKGEVFIIDRIKNQIIHKIDAHGMPVRKVIFSKDGNLIYTASDDRHVSVFDVSSGCVVNSFSHTGMAFCVDCSPDNRHFIVACADHTVALWDLGMQRQEQVFDSQHTDQAWGVSFDDTGNRFVSVGDDALLQMYERSVV
eukprot:gene2996-5874_t